MARGRMIDRRISKSDKLAALKSDRARVLYFLIYPHLDVEGRYSGDPKDIKEDCCPRLRYTIRRIAEAIIDLDRVNLLNLYEAKGCPYLEFTRFEYFQPGLRKDREAASDIPPYSGVGPEGAGKTPALYLSLSLMKFNEGSRRRSSNNITFDFEKRIFLNISKEHKETWGQAYPKCDIELCLRQMAAWLLADPKRRKTNYEKFIINWLKREQDSGGSKGGSVPKGTWLDTTKVEE